MLAVERDGSVTLMVDTTNAWMLYYLFAYLERPPTDDTIEEFEMAHDRATGDFADPDQLVEYLIYNVQWVGPRPVRDQPGYIRHQKRWQRFRDRYGHKTKQELLDVICFFQNQTAGRIKHQEAAE